MRIRQHIGNVERKCANCKYWDDFTGVCFNGNSDERAGFTDSEFVCKWHEWSENEPKEGLFGEE